MYCSIINLPNIVVLNQLYMQEIKISQNVSSDFDNY